MARDVFPRSGDRNVTYAFLRGLPTACASVWDSDMESDQGHLKMDHASASVMWFGPDGTLQALVSIGLNEHSHVRIINHVLETLGDDRRLVRESTDVGTVSVWVLDGSYVRVGTPFVLAGALTVQAWRAENK